MRFFLTAFLLGFCGVLAAHPDARAEDQAAGTSAWPAEDALETLILPRDDNSGTWELSIGADYSRGTYGADRATEVSYLPVGISYRTGRWRVALDSGFLKVQGPLDYASILDLSPEDIRALGLDDAETQAQGIGDTTAGVTYTAYENIAAGVFVDLGGRLKLPTASRAKGLGNGRFSGDLQIDAIKIVGRASLMISGTYGFRPRAHGGRNTVAVSGGVGYMATPQTSVGAIFEWRTSPAIHGQDSRTVLGYLSHALSDRVSVTLYGARGLEATSVALQAGLRFAYRLP